MMIRTFHSVGQGAFYTEEFDKFRFVYDCGTDTGGKKRIENYVKNHFKENEVIDYLFISHFHRDHINGLEYLFSKLKVKRVFIPQYDVYEHAIDFMHTDWNLNSFDTKLTIDPIGTINSISPETKIILVKKHPQIDERDERDERDDEIEGTNINTLNNGDSINSGERLQSCIPDWVFIPVNYNNISNSVTFRNHLNKLNIRFNTANDFITSWKNTKKRKNIKDAFKSIPKNQNENSMVVYSGPRMNSNKYSLRMFRDTDCHCHCPFNYKLFNTNAGCIYFGDYETHDKAWSTIKSALNKHYDLAGVIQIPHHGSSENYRNEIIKNNIYSVISYGTTNTHGHPGSFTTTSIVKNHSILLGVTENPSTRLYFVVR